MKRIEYKDVKFYFSDIRTKEHIFSLLSFVLMSENKSVFYLNVNLLSLYSSLTSYSFFFPSSLDNRIAQKLGPHIVQYSPSM